MDSNVFLSALRTRRGASFLLLGLVGTGKFDISLSVPLVLEYEQIARESRWRNKPSWEAVSDILDYLCDVGRKHRIHFLCRRTQMSAISLRLPDSLHNRARVLSKRDHVSINQFVATAVAEKIAALETEDYLAERAARASGKKFKAALAQVPDREPDKRDSL